MKDAQLFAKEWISAWNSHDLNEILKYYSEEVEIITPMIKIALGLDEGSLKGKAKVADYWGKALNTIPDLHFELLEVTQSINSIALYYKSVLDKNSIQLMFFDADGLINKCIIHYTL
ncbi:nuclear transport factor 2 family protein [Aureispira anguillae]|uniref:Nuclear transport factor 2 family protein n=1 Tax=Aureispira anguillae TaxID=2864201 RepID=A0A915VKB2_9BACT|nr:nuclear transport factor 2 family protein [Aureispira anguillae]BDS09500.1 nuclear transport factor 2 family protein [Aureispira anguillae]